MRQITTVAVFLVTIIACAALGGGAQERKSFWAFTGPWDPASDASLRANAGRLDVAVTGWIALDSLSGEPLLPSAYADTIRLAGGTARRFALVTSWHGQGFHKTSIRALGADPGRGAHVAGVIARYAQSMRYAGLVLDFETLKAADVEAHLAVVRAIADSARARGVTTIAVAVPAEPDEGYPTRELTRLADFVLVMLYDQHWPGSAPGPISAPDWMTRNLSRVVGEVGASRVIAGLPLYGYYWEKGKPGVGVSHAAALRSAQRDAIRLTRDSASNTLRGTGGNASLWVTDAALLDDLMRRAAQLGVTRFAFWRLGQEDPGMWSDGLSR
ncbi:MAG TPA: glycosyl hydrolase family 18 protein [Gemmatimonadaceae bacterium]|nr:glycosyl hydrolase family 18 protein [Gemmatimonadaceae bacterium]